jgi:Cyclic nucleotide-binding domain/PilZ domain
LVVSNKTAQRKDLRVVVRFPVLIRDPESGECIEANACDLSGSGMRVSSSVAPLEGSVVELELHVPGLANKLHLTGKVARVDAAREEGEEPLFMSATRFVRISNAMIRQIRRIVTQAVLEIGDLLRESPAFSGLTEFDLLAMSGICNSVHLDKGEILVRQGEEAKAMFLIVKGLLRLAPDDVEEHEIECQELVGCGQIFGEIPALTGLPHDLTVMALEPTQLVAISSAGVGFLKTSHPETMLRLMDIFIRITGLRVRRMTRRLYTPIRK